MSILFITPARLAGGDEIAVRAYWDRIELVLLPFSMRQGLRAHLSRIKWLTETGVPILFDTLRQLELTVTPGEPVGKIVVRSEDETYQLILPEVAGRRIMGLWMAARFGQSGTEDQ